MKMYKRILSLVLIVAMVFTFAACSAKTETATTASTSAETSTTATESADDIEWVFTADQMGNKNASIVLKWQPVPAHSMSATTSDTKIALLSIP